MDTTSCPEFDFPSTPCKTDPATGRAGCVALRDMRQRKQQAAGHGLPSMSHEHAIQIANPTGRAVRAAILIWGQHKRAYPGPWPEPGFWRRSDSGLDADPQSPPWDRSSAAPTLERPAPVTSSWSFNRIVSTNIVDDRNQYLQSYCCRLKCGQNAKVGNQNQGQLAWTKMRLAYGLRLQRVNVYFRAFLPFSPLP